MENTVLEAKKPLSGLNDQDVKELERETCKTSLKYLCEKILGFRDWDICHDRLLEWKHQNRDRRFKMYLMPRGMLKTSILTIGETIQDILKDFNTSILLSSAVWNNARSFLREIADQNMGYLTQKSSLPNLFGSFVSDKWNSEEIIIKQRTTSNKTPTIDTAGIDKVLTSQHYHKIKADDLVTRETTTTKEQIEKVVNHIKDLLKLLEPDGEMDIIGTRWDDQDSYDWVLKNLTKKEMGNEGFSIYKTSPAMDSSGKFIFMEGMKYPNGAIPIFPKKFPISTLELLRAQLGAYDYSCNIENNPTSPTNRIFQPPVRYWEKIPSDAIHTITVDPAISKKEDSCDAVVLDSFLTPGNQVGVAEYKAFSELDKHPTNIIEKIFEYVIRFKAKIVGIESNGYQEVLCVLLEDEMKKREIYFQIVPIRQSEDKARRIIGLQPLWERGDILLKPGMVELEEQFDKFRKPITAKVDILDALAMRLQLEIKHSFRKNPETLSPEDRSKQSFWKNGAYVPIKPDFDSVPILSY